MSSFSIRRAGTKDLPAVGQLAGDLVRLHHNWDPKRFMLVEGVEEGYVAWFRRELRRKAAVILLAEQAAEDGGPAQLIGYAYGTVEDRDWNALLDRAGWIHDLYVAPVARAQGVGKSLLQHMMLALAELGVPRAVLVSATHNEAAQALFASVGFRHTMVEMTAELGGEARPRDSAALPSDEP